MLGFFFQKKFHDDFSLSSPYMTMLLHFRGGEFHPEFSSIKQPHFLMCTSSKEVKKRNKCFRKCFLERSQKFMFFSPLLLPWGRWFIVKGKLNSISYWLLFNWQDVGGWTDTWSDKVMVCIVQLPNHQRWYAQSGSSVGNTVFFCTFGTDLYAQSVISNKIAASELGRKFNKGPLLVGQQQKLHTKPPPTKMVSKKTESLQHFKVWIFISPRHRAETISIPTWFA